ncbi:hypothetical protein KUCAC02_006999 [Chaenocephalus aceratus]|nr:hypothetical protein KUCAC02_006999 [Chaenocephalus aceratus]
MLQLLVTKVVLLLILRVMKKPPEFIMKAIEKAGYKAIKAHYIYRKDDTYVVQNGQVQIVDEFTGRILHGRRYSDGLHQAIEAKEGIKVAKRNVTLATITLQNFFRMYKKIAGMTGTADTEAHEFSKIYGLDVVVIPSNRPLVRIDHYDEIYFNEQFKFDAIVNEIVKYNEKGQPILLGTYIAYQQSEYYQALDQYQHHPVQYAEIHQGHHYREVYTAHHHYREVYTAHHHYREVYTAHHHYREVYTARHHYREVYTAHHRYREVYTAHHRYREVYTAHHRYRRSILPTTTTGRSILPTTTTGRSILPTSATGRRPILPTSATGRRPILPTSATGRRPILSTSAATGRRPILPTTLRRSV